MFFKVALLVPYTVHLSCCFDLLLLCPSSLPMFLLCLTILPVHLLCATSLAAHALLCAVGLAGAWIGLTIQHCGNHGAMSTSPAVNKAMGLTDDLIGGSSLMWRYHHQASIHICTCLHSTAFCMLSPAGGQHNSRRIHIAPAVWFPCCHVGDLLVNLLKAAVAAANMRHSESPLYCWVFFCPTALFILWLSYLDGTTTAHL